MQFSTKQTSLIFSGVGALAAVAAASTFLVRRFLKRRREHSTAHSCENGSPGPSIVEDIVFRNVQGF